MPVLFRGYEEIIIIEFEAVDPKTLPKELVEKIAVKYVMASTDLLYCILLYGIFCIMLIVFSFNMEISGFIAFTGAYTELLHNTLLYTFVPSLSHVQPGDKERGGSQEG